jgi:hypothetical protein
MYARFYKNVKESFEFFNLKIKKMLMITGAWSGSGGWHASGNTEGYKMTSVGNSLRKTIEKGG